MERYLVTGAAGNLGSHIVNVLTRQKKQVRALVLRGDPAQKHLPKSVEIAYGDVTQPDTLAPFFEADESDELIVIHAAGIVTIYPEYSERVWNVNVGGTRNIVELCVKRKVKKLVYVSSVHAIVPLPDGETMSEPTSFEPDRIEGFYGKTKAEAAKLVAQAVERDGLNASIVFPSGLCGPGDYSIGHVTRLVLDCLRGRLPAGVKGAYDFSDVRDVAEGIVTAAQVGGKGQNYILGNRRITVKEVLDSAHQRTGCKPVKVMLPLWLAKLGAPFCEAYYRIKKRTPLFTRYALSTLGSNANFTSAKAVRELGYKPRPFADTVADTAKWLVSEKLVAPVKRRFSRHSSRK